IDNNPKNNDSANLEWVSPSEHMAFQFKMGNKDNYKVWKVRKKKYKNGFKPDTIFKGRPRKSEEYPSPEMDVAKLEMAELLV
ncbi:MAG: hypothetical protein AAGC88_09775, partial [Bacteroidota bacterium]